ncbi:MAG: acetate--CoA ligase family protein [Solirubrobacterales bacterium]
MKAAEKDAGAAGKDSRAAGKDSGTKTAGKPPGRSLECLYEPRTVAVVGASADPMKWGHWLSRDALEGADRRDVFLVNARGGEILGQRAYASVSELPEPPELVVLTVPASRFEEAVDDSLRAGARALVAITSGFADTGEEGRARQESVVASVREAGALMLGPNCGGVADLGSGLRLGLGGLVGGPIGLVCQSGNVALELARIAAREGLGFTRVASIGNQADLEIAELVADLAAHDATEVIALYVEDFRGGRALTGAMIEAGKPVVVLPAGSSDAGARAAASHTGAMVSGGEVVAAACRLAGAVRVSSLTEMAEAAKVLVSVPRPAGPRVAIVTDGGGHGVIAADLASEAGLDLPPLSSGLGERILASLPGRPVPGNPLDLAGAGDEDLCSYERVIAEIGASGEADSILLTGYFGGYSVDAGEGAGAEERESEVARGMAEAARRHGLPLLAQTMHWDSSPALALRAAGVPLFARVDDAVAALARIVEAGPGPAGPLPAMPAAQAPVSGQGYWVAREVLADAGIPLVEARRVESAEARRVERAEARRVESAEARPVEGVEARPVEGVEARPVEGAEARPVEGVEAAVRAADQLGYPVVLKAADLLHKSDLGGVALGLEGPGELRAAFDAMAATGSATYSVEPMTAPEGAFELLVGARRDPRFGPVVAVAAGGIYAELLDDVAVALAPLDADRALEMLASLRAAPLLEGARGRPAVDLHAAAEAIASLSTLAASHPDLAELEINPLVVWPGGALGLDARIVPEATSRG